MAPIQTPTLTQLFFSYLDPRKSLIWIIFFVILAISVAIYGYYQFYLPVANGRNFNNLANKKPTANGLPGAGGDVLIYFFHVDWCPHCKTAAPEWKTFSDNYNGAEANGYTIKCINKDCTEDSNPEIQELIQTHKIEGYPTIKMIKDGKTIDFDAKVTNHFLEQFVINMVGPMASK